MPTPIRGKSSIRALTALVGVVATILVGWVLISAAPILQPLVIAVLLCNVLQPVVRTLARYRIPSWATVVMLLGLLLYAMITGGHLLFAQIQDFVGEQGVGGDQGVRKLREQLIARIQGYELVPDGFGEAVINFIKDVDLTSIVVNLFGTVKDFMLGLFLVVLYMIFIFAEQAVFRRKIIAVAQSRGPDAEKALISISLRIQRYLGVKTVTSLSTGVLCYSVLLYLNLPYALLFGFMTYLLNYIPTFGSLAAAILPISTAIADREGLTDPLIVAGTYIVVNVMLGSFIEPRLLGRELNLSPLVILVSVVVWAGLWGVTGTFLAVPLTATAQIILSNYESTRGIAILLSNGPPREKPHSSA
jgi:AI-2 transport protein TqsA